MKYLLIMVFSLFLSACAQPPKAKFVVLSDVHIGKAGAAERLEDAVAYINDLDADFVIVTGDIATMGVRDSAAGVAEMEQFVSIMANLNCPYYTIPGNHELGYREYALDELDRTDPALPNYLPLSDYETNVANFEAIVGPRDMEFIEGDYQFILIDDNPLYSGAPAYVTNEQIEWIETLLQRGRPTFVFAHVQLLKNGNEEPWGSRAIKLVPILESYPNFKGFFNGHIDQYRRVTRGGATYMTAAGLTGGDETPIYRFTIGDGYLDITEIDIETGAETLRVHEPL